MDRRLKDLSDYRLEQAKRCIKSARILAEDGDYKERQTDLIMLFFIV